MICYGKTELRTEPNEKYYPSLNNIIYFSKYIKSALDWISFLKH